MLKLCLYTIPVLSQGPLPVTDINFDVTSSTAKLTWKAPSNVPKTLEGLYYLNDPLNSIVESSETESCILKNLTAYHQYNVSISLHVDYGNETYIGAEAHCAYMTEVDRPGRVQRVEVSQDLDLFQVRWKPPTADQANGPIDFYYVKVFDEGGAILRSL